MALSKNPLSEDEDVKGKKSRIFFFTSYKDEAYFTSYKDEEYFT